MRCLTRYQIIPLLVAVTLIAATACSGKPVFQSEPAMPEPAAETDAGTAAERAPEPAAGSGMEPAPGSENMMMAGPDLPTITFGDLGWESAVLQNRIVQYLVEFGYGHPTGVEPGGTTDLFEKLKEGGIDVMMEIWLPNLEEEWTMARDSGSVTSAGQSLGKDWQSAFVIPAYLQEEHPGLDSIEDLKNQEYAKLFRTADTGERARLLSCVEGWACAEVNDQQVSAYGLDEYVETVRPADAAALDADLYEAYLNREPWLGYQWGTNRPALTLDLVRLAEPEYSHECWFSDKACAYQDSTILIAVHPTLAGNAPEVFELLRRWSFDVAVYQSVTRWQDHNPEAGPEETARWWLEENGDVWGEWLTPEAAESVTGALEAESTPAGWPMQQ